MKAIIKSCGIMALWGVCTAVGMEAGIALANRASEYADDAKAAIKAFKDSCKNRL